MALPFTTASFAALYQTGQPQISHPIPQDPAHTVLKVSFECSAANYLPGSLDDTYLFNAVTYYQVHADEAVWRDGSLMKMAKSYCNQPSARNEYQSYEMYFPAFAGVNTGFYYSRFAFRKIVSSRLAYAYFHTATPTASVTTYAGFQVLQRGTASYAYVNYVLNDYLTGSGTSPSYAAYLALLGTELVAETTTWKRYQGNFWEAVTRYVTAE